MPSVIRNPKDFLSGLIFVLVGLGFIWIGQDYAMGTPRRMGPGYFPTILAICLVVIGIVLMARAFRLQGERITGFTAKGLFLVLVSTVSFGILIRQGGMVPAVASLTVISALASIRFKVRTAFIMAALISAFCVTVFSYALGLPIPAFGPWFGG